MIKIFEFIFLLGFITFGLIAHDRDTVKSDLPIVVDKFSLTNDPNNKNDKAEAFTTSDQRIHAFAVFHCHEEGNVTFEWHRNGKVYASVTTPIKSRSPHWHSNSSVHALEGDWEVKIIDDGKNVLHQQSFTISNSDQNSEENVNASAAVIEDKANTKKKKKKNKIKNVNDALKALEPSNKEKQ